MTERYGAYGERYADSYGTYGENGVDQGAYYRNGVDQGAYYRGNDTGSGTYYGNGAGPGTYYGNGAGPGTYYGNGAGPGTYYGNGSGQGTYYSGNGTGQGAYYRNGAGQGTHYGGNGTAQGAYYGNEAGQGTYYRNDADQSTYYRNDTAQGTYYRNDTNQDMYYNGNSAGYGGQYEEQREDHADSHSGEHEGIYEEPYEENQGMNSQGATAFSKAGILKWGAAFLILVYIVLLLIYTSGSTKPFDEVASSVEQQLDKENLVKQDARALKRYYGLNSADYDGVLYYSAEFSISALEVLLIEVKTDQQVQEVRDAIEERLESRRNTFEGYAPEQAQLIEQAQILARGRFIFLAVSPDAENYVTAFTKGL